MVQESDAYVHDDYDDDYNDYNDNHDHDDHDDYDDDDYNDYNDNNHDHHQGEDDGKARWSRSQMYSFTLQLVNVCPSFHI